MARRKRDQRTKHTCGMCNYCTSNLAHKMVKIVKGANAKYRRWICESCILKRQQLGLIKTDVSTNEYARIN